MTSPPVSGSAPASERVGSIDLLRGLTILVMLFVNDLAGVAGAPAWLRHVQPPDADSMTLPDLVFPAFLFIVGLSLPIALERRLAATGPLGTVAHVGLRALSLLLIGVFMVNSEQIPAETPVYRALWNLLLYLGVILVWLTPHTTGPPSRAGMLRRGAGMAILIGAALWFRDPSQNGWLQLRPHWWGILGLIGWAYLVSAVVYLALRQSPAGQVAAIGLLYSVYLADRAGFFEPISVVDRWVDVGSMLGSLPAITLSGALAGHILLLAPGRSSHLRKAGVALQIGLVLAAAGVLLHALHRIHPMFIVNKIAATPAWCLLSSACTVWTWAILHLLTDAVGWGGRPRWLTDAGRHALFAFIAGPILYALFELAAASLGGWPFYAKLGASFDLGFWRSLLFAVAVTWFTGWLWRRGWSLKL